MELTAGLLKTKYTVPVADKRLVARQTINCKLEEALSRKLTLILAPAGFGKTSAVIKWLETVSLPVSWFTIDAGDNDAVTFWRYLSMALDAVLPGISRDAQYVFSSPELQNAHIHINIIIDRLSELQSDFLLILDDLHLITEPAILQGLSYMIDYLPARMHLVVLSRTEPAFNKAGQKIKWQTHSLNEKDLRFSEKDILNFYRARGCLLDNDDLKNVVGYTEGWAAALVAVSISMEREGVSSGIAAMLAQSSRDIDEYLEEEVLTAWSSEIRDFAMKTSILETLTEPLCDAVTDKANAGRLLGEMSEKNGFLSALDADGHEYRYHRLFSRFLYSRLTATMAGELPSLHERAAHWYLHNGYLSEAMEHLLSGRLYNKAAEIIEHRVDHMINRNEFGPLLSWIDRLPAEFSENSFKIAVIHSVYNAEIGNYELSRQWVERMKALKDIGSYGANSELNGYSHTVCTMIEANLLIREGNMAFLSLVQTAADANGGRFYKMPAYNDFNTSDVYFYRCPISRLTELFKGAPDKYSELVDYYRTMISQNPGYAPLCIGEYLYETSRQEEALPWLLKAQEEAREANCPGAFVPAMVDIARIKRASGDIYGAYDIVVECEKQLQSGGKRHWLNVLNAFRCRLYIDTENMEKVREWVTLSRLDIFSGINRIREFEILTFARGLMALGKTQDARLLLHRIDQFTNENARPHSRVEALNLLALLAFGESRMRHAFDYLDESLAIGRKEGYARIYLDEWLDMARLLRAYIKSRRSQNENSLSEERKSFAASLLKQMPESLLETLQAYKEINTEKSTDLLAHLTEQERRVLILLANAATNQEICDKLQISLRTVKTHTGNIYSKLGIKTRSQCVKLVHELGLV